MNYGQLKSDIADWINRTDLADQIPNFVRFAESDIFRGFVGSVGTISLRVRENEKSAQLTVVDGVITLPDDYRELKEVTQNSRGLKIISDQYYNRLQQYNGQTKVISLREDAWYQYPRSDTDDTLDIIYFADLSDQLVNDSDTNEVLTNLYDLYLWGSLSYAELYVKNDARSAMWKSELESGIRGANADYRRAQFAGATPAQRTQYREVQTIRTADR